MKTNIITLSLCLMFWACGNHSSSNADAKKVDSLTTSQNSTDSICPSSTSTDDSTDSPLEKITNQDFKTFIGAFAIGKFPWDVNETPLLTEGVPENLHEISLENITKFINPDITENKGYYTGYALFEKEYIAIIYYYSYSNLFGGENYHTSTNLLTFGFDGQLIGKVELGEVNTWVNSTAQRESQKIEGLVYSDKPTSIKVNSFIEDQPNSEGKTIAFTINQNGEIVL